MSAGEGTTGTVATQGSLEPMALERLLDRTSFRLALRTRLASAAWIGLGAVISLELGALAARGVGSMALVLGEVTAAGLGAATLAALLRGQRPSSAEAARAIDGVLGRGALVETAAEALSGRHGAFAGLAVKEARHHSRGLTPASVVPLEAPRGLWFGGGAALLLLALALGPASEGLESATEPRLVLAPEGPPSTNGSPTNPNPRPSETPNVMIVRPAAPANGTPTTAPLSPEAAKQLATRINELLPFLKPRAGATARATPDEDQARKSLEDAIKNGDAAKASEALSDLASHGTQASADELKKLGARLEADSRREGKPLEGKPGETTAQGGAGNGANGATPAPMTPGTPVVTGPDAGGPEAPGRDGHSARAVTSWRVHAAETRYRQALEESRGGS